LVGGVADGDDETREEGVVGARKEGCVAPGELRDGLLRDVSSVRPKRVDGSVAMKSWSIG
jgi:hypothetical protein